MRKHIYILTGLLALTTNAMAQEIMDIPEWEGGAGVSKTENYVRIISPTVPTSTLGGLGNNEAMQTIQYIDGLGRTKQTIQQGVTSMGKDLVEVRNYDHMGRNIKTQLPVVASSGQGSYISEIQSLVASTYPDDSNPCTRIEYDNSPLSREVKQYGPGNDWVNKPVKIEYVTVANTLPCYEYAASNDAMQVRIVKRGAFGGGNLFITKLTDESGNVSYEFKNRNNQVILTRQMNGSTPHDTYYIYDIYGNLRAVLPPAAVDALSGDGPWTESTTAMANYAYLYKYDEQKRCISKKLPGCGWTHYIYDKANRLIFMQDPIMRDENTNKWHFTIPDVLGRTAVTGTFVKNLSYIANPLGGVVMKATRTNATDTYKGYSISGISGQTSVQILTANYYDDYNFIGANGISSADAAYNAETGYNTRHMGSYKGLLTGTLTAQMGPDGVTDTYLYSVMYYDYRGRLIQTKSNSHLEGGVEREYVAYNFVGQPIKKKHVHSATGKTTQTELYAYTYDHAGRLTQVEHGINTASADIVIASNGYDELGRLQTNTKGLLPATTYAYNIRSWLETITSDLYSQTLYYNKSYNRTTQYNGNVSAMTWKIANEATRSYLFEYDGLSRLTSADYLVNETSNAHTCTCKVYGISYDKNGNIKSIDRWGRIDTGCYIMDGLSMWHTGNQLTGVTDRGYRSSSPQIVDFRDYSNASIEYAYNQNGALIQDLNKGISSISYNALSLPSRMDIKSPVAEARNDYIYSADGRKLKVVQKWNPNYSTTPVIGSAIAPSSLTQTRTTDYVGNKVYENGVLKRTLIDGGYIENGTYHYYLTDHLGNNRVVAKGTGTIVQRNHYYPFGLTFGEISNAEQGVQAYKFGGKELDRMHGLNWYDFSARHCDAAIGRFTTMDPLAEKYYSISPYAYCANNPMRYVDPTGMDWYEDEDGNAQWRRSRDKEYTDENGTVWKNIGTEYLLFDGNKLYYFQQQQNEDGDITGLWAYSYGAVSGRMQENKTFSYTEENQAQKETGPIPDGLYSVNPQQIQNYSDLSFFNKALCQVGAGAFPGGTRSWGENRVWISPKSVPVTNPKTGEVVERTGLSIHGGSVPGSGGCIDLYGYAPAFFNRLSKSNSSFIRLNVLYKPYNRKTQIWRTE